MPKNKAASYGLLASRFVKYVILLIMGISLLLAIVSIIIYSGT